MLLSKPQFFVSLLSKSLLPVHQLLLVVDLPNGKITANALPRSFGCQFH
jgi:hypothetical protein